MYMFLCYTFRAMLLFLAGCRSFWFVFDWMPELSLFVVVVFDYWPGGGSERETTALKSGSVWTHRISPILSPLSISWLKTKGSTEVPEVSEETIFDVLNGFHLKPSRIFLKTTVCHFDVILGSPLLTQLWSQMKAPSHVSKQSVHFLLRTRNLAGE